MRWSRATPPDGQQCDVRRFDAVLRGGERVAELMQEHAEEQQGDEHGRDERAGGTSSLVAA
jgi:hypothetical protein